jgi:DNA-binding GntR family transcriptional regulator
LRDVVCDVLRDQIVDGERLPGSRLIEDRLAENLGVSRNPVREALRVLESEGYVVMNPRRGAFVAELSYEDVLHTFEVRGALEQLAWRLAARRAAAADVARLEQMLSAMRDALAAGDDARSAALHDEFHALVLDIGDNEILKRIMESFRTRMRWITRGETWDLEPSIAGHEQLVAALAANEENEAARLADEHIHGFQEAYWNHRSGRDVEVVTSH